MIIVKIKAGLGNQMFQYALGKRLSLDWSDELLFDFSWFDTINKKETYREIEITEFNVVMNKAAQQDIRRVSPKFIPRLFGKIRGRFNRNYFYTFHPSLLKKRKDIFLDGYFQSHKYFDSIRDVLLESFVLKKGFSADAQKIENMIEGAGESVAVHIRRGDYVSSCKDWNGLCSIEYYEKALLAIKEKYPTVTVFVYSDDIEWAKENLKLDSQVVFVSRPGFTAAEELLLMSLCKHQIIANSTFSWWAAWLNKHKEKIVVAPSRWLVVSNIQTKDLLPSDWIQI